MLTFHSLSSLSCADNIRYGCPEATLDDCTAAAKTANALEFIEALPSRFNTAIGDQQIMLSGGQKQRIAIARAMLRQPQVRDFFLNVIQYFDFMISKLLSLYLLTYRFWYLMRLLLLWMLPLSG
jgi:ABC-type dipeptide/oligopeptide/nickel transport system ATPase subunit